MSIEKRDRSNGVIDDMWEYVCDTLCKFRGDNSLTQEELDARCEGCKLEAYTGDILGSLQTEAAKRSVVSWKDRMMNRFMRTD